MSSVSYETLTFTDHQDRIGITLLRFFSTSIPKSSLPGLQEVTKHSLKFTQLNPYPRFQKELTVAFAHLTNAVSKKPSIYVHRQSTIPLIGQSSFGIIDRNSSLLEVKPITGCNINCIFCSVDEGKGTKKVRDFIVEKDYLIQELQVLIEKKHHPIHIYINTQGEPTLYADMIQLVQDLSEIQKVRSIAVNTNGTLLTKEYIDELVNAGITQLNLSLNAMSPTIATKLAGQPYPLDHVLSMARYAANKLSLIIAPVWVPGMNDAELPKIIEFALSCNAKIGIQNFLPYKRGRNPVKPTPMDVFYEKLQQLEEEYKCSLIVSANDFDIKEDKVLDQPMKKGDIVTGTIVASGRYPHEKLLLAHERTVLVQTDKEFGKSLTIKITRSKHNIYTGIIQ
jgi:uncharacterized protein